MKYCCCAGIEHAELLAELGFDGIELPGAVMASVSEEDWNGIRKKVVNGPIPCVGFNAALPPQIKICGPGFDMDRAKAYAEVLCRRLHELGGKTIGIGSPGSRILPGGYDLLAAREQMKEFFVMFADAAASRDLHVGWETLNPSETNFGLSFAEDAQVIRILKDDGARNAGLIADLFHMIVNGVPAEEAARFSDLVLHVHIAEPPADFRGYPTRAYASRYRELLEAILKNTSCTTISVETPHPISASRAKEALAVLRELCK